MEDLQKKFKFAGSKLADFVTVRRPDMNQLKWNYWHVQDKSFYMVSTWEHQIHFIPGAGVYSRIETEIVQREAG